MWSELHLWELQLMQQLANLRNAWTDAFFFFMAYFDTPLLPITLIPLVWYGVSRRWGAVLHFMMLFNSLLNTSLKHLFESPRPLHLDPTLGLIDVWHSYGFPSGAAQTSILLPGMWIAAQRTRLSWVVGILFCLSLASSRIYLGAHFFTDILGGWISGGLLLTCYLKWTPAIERKLAQWSQAQRLLIAIGLPLAILSIFPGNTVAIAGLMIGAGLGLCYVDGAEGDFYQRDLRPRIALAAGVAGTVLVLQATLPGVFLGLGIASPIHKVLSYTVQGLWLSIGAVRLFQLVAQTPYQRVYAERSKR